MLSLEYLFYCATLLATFVPILICIVLYKTSERYPTIWKDDREKFLFGIEEETEGEEIKSPPFHDPSTIDISVVVPAYNEEHRLPFMLDKCLEQLNMRKKICLSHIPFNYEVIIVNDGSTDKTKDVAQDYADKHGNVVKVLNLIKNRGKGGAVRLGMLSARGKYVLFADADGATEFNDFSAMEMKLREILPKFTEYRPGHRYGIACGSRAHLDANVKRSFFRQLLMHAFHSLVCFLGVTGIRDTQCGFKLLTRETARVIFKALHIEGWAFDVEMLYIAQQLNIPIVEVPVTWTEMEGSKLIPVLSGLRMAMDLILMWLKYKIGAWKIYKPKDM